MVVGRMPLLEEESILVDSGLSEVGFSREHCWVTYVNKCGSGKMPTSYGEQEACMGYLAAEIRLVRPKLIIALGNEAMSAVTPYQSGVMKHCGEVLDNPCGRVGQIDCGCKVIISVHPAKSLRDNEGKEHWNFFISKLKELVNP